MRNFFIRFGKILETCKIFAGNLVNEKGNVPRRGVVPKFSDLEVVALSITAEAKSIDSENYPFTRLNKECPDSIPNLITRRLYNQHRKKTMMFGENIRQAIAMAIDGEETVFSQLNEHLMMIRNYAKKPSGLFARMEAKVAVFTVLQYFNLLNHSPIGQVKYALFLFIQPVND